MTRFFQVVALVTFFGLLFSLLAWITLSEHAANYPTYAIIIIATLPLLFPLRGLLHGKPYTYAWYSFILLFYFAHGIGELYSSQNKLLYPMLEVIFSTLSFVASITYIKLHAKK